MARTATAEALVAAVAGGDRLEVLIALAKLCAERLADTTSARDSAALVKRLDDLISEITWAQGMAGIDPTDPIDAQKRRLRLATNEQKFVAASSDLRKAMRDADGSQ